MKAHPVYPGSTRAAADGAQNGANGKHEAAKTPTIVRSVHARIPTLEGEFQLYHYTNDYDGKEHLAIVMGNLSDDAFAGAADGAPVLVRVHSECFTGDVLGSRRCDCGEQLHRAMQMVAAAGRGVIIYLRQEGRGIGLADKLRAYNLQDLGYDTVEANLLLGHQADERDYWAAAAILDDLKVASINLMTNNPAKIEHLRALGVRVESRVPIEAEVNADNRAYLETKAQRMRHMLDLPAVAHPTFPDDVANALDALDHAIAGHTAARPFVTLAWAQSLDGSIAGPNREPLRLSGNESMRLTHSLRTAHDAILVGIGTVLADDPRLTARTREGGVADALAPRQPRPVILDGDLRTPPNALLFAHPRPPLIFTREGVDPARQKTLAERGAEIVFLPQGENGHLSLTALLDELARRGIHSLMVEGGATVIDSFLAESAADRLVVTIAPRTVNGLRLKSAATLPAGARFTPLGADVIFWAEVEPTAQRQAL